MTGIIPSAEPVPCLRKLMKGRSAASVPRWRPGVLVLLVLAFVAITVAIYAGLFDGRRSFPDHSAMRGRGLWQAHNCQACHQLFGLGGFMGPDLTNIVRVRDDSRLRTFIRYGTGRMPAHALADSAITDLLAYLRWVDRHGTSQVPAEAVHWTGTYVFPNERP